MTRQKTTSEQGGRVFSCTISSWERVLPALLDATDLKERAQRAEVILIKPNLVQVLQPPITVPVELVRLLIMYLQERLPDKDVIIGEGTGAKEYDTHHCFDKLGYTQMAGELGVELIDLNQENAIKKSRDDCPRWPQMHLPAILDDVFLLSVPVLKAHSLADVTLTMKNMMGCPPPHIYQQGGHWKKSSFHTDVHQAIFDLNKYRTPDFTLLDGTIGMAEAHLWGPKCDPPVNRLAASADPVAIDAYGCYLLGKRWQEIDHIKMAHGVLGSADTENNIEIQAP